MAQPSNSFSGYDAKGIREDLADVIYRIDPTETPFQSSIGTSKATAKYHEWQTQALATAVATNAVIEGDDATTDAVTATVRVGNRTHISDKVARVTGTLEATDRAGRDSEMCYQVLLKGLELKRDIESQLCSNKASVAGNDTLASVSGGFSAWLESNTDFGTSGADGGFSSGVVSARTDGNTRKFTQAQLDSVLETTYTNGGNPTILMMPPSLKTGFSAFTGIADLRRETGGKGEATIVAGADYYISNFGNLQVIPQRFMRATDVYLIDPKHVKKALLRPMKNWELAKTGDTERRQILEEYTLEVCNEKAHGLIADVTKTS